MKLLHPSLALLLLLGSCGGGASSASPDGAVLNSVQALRNDNLAAFFHGAFTEAEFGEMRAKWDEQRLATPEEEEQARFADSVAMLTAPGAESALMQKLEPQLVELKPQVDMLFGMVEGMAAGALAGNTTMTAQERQQAQQVVQALVTTLRENDITDPERARKAVGIVCKSARRLGVKTLADAQAMTFDQALARGGVLLACSKDVLEVYGFAVDTLLDSVRTRTVMQSGDAATIEVRFTLLGVQHTQQMEMMRVAGHWVVRRTPETAPAEPETSLDG
jgi:hypothetical protein